MPRSLTAHYRTPVRQARARSTSCLNPTKVEFIDSGNSVAAFAQRSERGGRRQCRRCEALVHVGTGCACCTPRPRMWLPCHAVPPTVGATVVSAAPLPLPWPLPLPSLSLLLSK